MSELIERLNKIEREVAEVRELLTSKVLFVDETAIKEMKDAVKDYLSLRDSVSNLWKGPSVLREFRRSRGHGE